MILQSLEPVATDFTKLFLQYVPLLSLVCNAIVAYLVFRSKSNIDSEETERKIRMDWFKTLILDSNLKYFHEFFENVEIEMLKLRQNSDDKDLKILVNEKIKDLNKDFYRNFIDLLIAIDYSIFKNIGRISDKMIDNFTEAISDDGIKLSHPPQFEKLVTKELAHTKTDIIQELFKYKGLPAQTDNQSLSIKK